MYPSLRQVQWTVRYLKKQITATYPLTNVNHSNIPLALSSSQPVQQSGDHPINSVGNTPTKASHSGLHNNNNTGSSVCERHSGSVCEHGLVAVSSGCGGSESSHSH